MPALTAYLTPQNIAALAVLVVVGILLVTQQPIPRELIDLLLALLGLGAGLFIENHKRG